MVAGSWDALATPLLVSLSVAGRALLFGLPLAAAMALLLSRARFPGKTLVDAVVHAPMVLPPVVAGFGLLLLFGAHGVFGPALKALGVRLAFTASGAALADGVMAFPLMVRTLRLTFDAIDPGLEAAARSLGAGPVDRLFSLILPLSAPGILAAALTGFAACMGEFGAVITFAADTPGETETLPLAIYSALQTPGGDALAIRLSLIAFTAAVAALGLSEVLMRRLKRLTEG